MDVHGLANGAYLLELLSDQGPRAVGRFVKQ